MLFKKDWEFLDLNDSLCIVISILIFKEGKLVSIYNIKEDNYNIEKVEKYLKEQGVIYD